MKMQTLIPNARYKRLVNKIELNMFFIIVMTILFSFNEIDEFLNHKQLCVIKLKIKLKIVLKV